MIGTELNTEDYKYPSRDEIKTPMEIVSKAIKDAPEDGSLLSTQHDTIAQSVLALTEHTLKLIKEKGWQGKSVATSESCLQTDN